MLTIGEKNCSWIAKLGSDQLTVMFCPAARPVDRSRSAAG
jgi:hypothetical protein